VVKPVQLSNIETSASPETARTHAVVMRPGTATARSMPQHTLCAASCRAGFVTHCKESPLASTICSANELPSHTFACSAVRPQVSLATAYRSSEAKWMELFPDFQGWVQLRVQHLQQDSSGWPPLLVQRAVKWCAANAQPAKPARTASAGKAAYVQPGGSRNAAATGSNASSAPNRRQHRRGRGRNAPQA
jgi:hypothetical protein